MQNQKNKRSLGCSCRDKNGYPLHENCRTEIVIYMWTLVTKSNFKKVYLIVSEGELKKEILKIVLHCQHNCGVSNHYLKQKMTT